MRIHKACALLAIAIVNANVAFANDSVHETTLDNGLKVVIKEDHRAPVAVAQLWYKVGASYEHSGITGVSHVLEHMMFKGTERYPHDRFSAIIAENGGRENAFTGRDYTGYFQLLDSSRLETSLELEADRMTNLSFPQDQFEKELEVVKEERRLRTEDDPRSLTYEQLFAAAYLNGPYHNPIVGWMEDLNSMQLSDLQDWYRRWYAPGNATLVIVGDVDPALTLTLVKQHYGKIEPRAVPPFKPRNEVTQRGERRVAVKAPAKLPYLLIGYKVPVLAQQQQDEDWEIYALDVLAGVLDGGRSSRLSKRLVRELEVAASASAGYNAYARHKELFLLEGVPGPGRTVADLEQALEEEVARVKEELVSAHELDRVKAQVLAGEIYQQDSVMSQSYAIGILESVGLDWRLIDEYVDRIKAVTAEQVRDVASKYLISERKTVAVLEPQPIAQAAAEKEASDG
ncbi:MAG: M16 family metallopeptidase [Gammaproteobacteria bacterium]